MKVEEILINPIPYETTKLNLNKTKAEDSFSSVLASTIKEHNSNNSAPIQKERTNIYNVRNASFEEFEAIVFKLYETGQMSCREHGSATFNPTNDPLFERWWLTPANSDGRRDWIAEWEARAQRDASHGWEGFEISQRIVEVLKGLPATGVEVEQRIIDYLKELRELTEESPVAGENNENKATSPPKKQGLSLSSLYLARVIAGLTGVEEEDKDYHKLEENKEIPQMALT